MNAMLATYHDIVSYYYFHNYNFNHQVTLCWVNKSSLLNQPYCSQHISCFFSKQIISLGSFMRFKRKKKVFVILGIINNWTSFHSLASISRGIFIILLHSFVSRVPCLLRFHKGLRVSSSPLKLQHQVQHKAQVYRKY